MRNSATSKTGNFATCYYTLTQSTIIPKGFNLDAEWFKNSLMEIHRS